MSPAKTAQSPDLSPLRSPGSHLNQEGSQLRKFSSRVWPENNHVDAHPHPHPLPLPPRASPQTTHSSPQQQPTMANLTTENSPSMKGQWQKGKLIGRGSYGSVYHATNLYALHPSLYSLLCKVLNCCTVMVSLWSLILWKIADKCDGCGCNCYLKNLDFARLWTVFVAVDCILKPFCYLLYTFNFSVVTHTHSCSVCVRETGASCAMKEVDLFPDDPKSADCIKQLEQVLPLCVFNLIIFKNNIMAIVKNIWMQHDQLHSTIWLVVNTALQLDIAALSL